MTTLEILEAARRLIEKRENWTRAWWALDAAGNPVDSTDPSGVCFCIAGAINRASDRNGRAAFEALERQITSGPRQIIQFNGGHTHEEVLALFDRAIAAERLAHSSTVRQP